eukprot:scaffold1019_cov172-Amphora_coffeaeformis.AAC.6
MPSSSALVSYCGGVPLFLLLILVGTTWETCHAWVPSSCLRRRRLLLRSSSSSPCHLLSRQRRTTSAATTVVLRGVADDLLYQEQEKLLVNRGALEGELMKDTAAPLQTYVVKGAGSKGGFGGGGGGGSKNKKANKKASSSSSATTKAQAKELAKVLQQQGVVRVDQVLSHDTVDALRAFLYNLRHESEALVAAGTIQPIQRFADVLLRQNRCDMPVPLGPEIVTQALDEVLVQSPVGGVIQNLLTEKAVLYELSCLMSDPGSQRQVVHPDTPYSPQSDDPVLYTCFVALQDITLDMGPTTWLPHTHTLDMHDAFQDETTPHAPGSTESRKDHLLRTQPAVLGTLPKGSCGMYDSRLLHCGGANQSDTSRALFYFSFKNPSMGAVGTPTQVSSYQARQTLSSLLHIAGKEERGRSG